MMHQQTFFCRAGSLKPKTPLCGRKLSGVFARKRFDTAHTRYRSAFLEMQTLIEPCGSNFPCSLVLESVICDSFSLSQAVLRSGCREMHSLVLDIVHFGTTCVNRALCKIECYKQMTQRGKAVSFFSGKRDVLRTFWDTQTDVGFRLGFWGF